MLSIFNFSHSIADIPNKENSPCKYCGNPLKVVEDCPVITPILYPVLSLSDWPLDVDCPEPLD